MSIIKVLALGLLLSCAAAQSTKYLLGIAHHLTTHCSLHPCLWQILCLQDWKPLQVQLWLCFAQFTEGWTQMWPFVVNPFSSWHLLISTQLSTIVR
jgi:hypothetical protein